MQVFFGNPRRFALSPCALTIGNFDGVHRGHQRMLERLRSEADSRQLPAALLTFEPHPREFFARGEPTARLSTLRDKLAFLRESGLIDYVFVFRFNHGFSGMSAQDFMQHVLRDALQARYLLIGDDFQFGAGRRGDFAMLSSAPWLVTEAMPSVLVEGERASSSLVRDRLAAGDLQGAATLLGRTYQLSGRVVHGKKLGRTIGFPTANVHLPHRKPALSGVFVVEADTPAGRFGGVASLGRNPTVSQTQDYKLEVHLFDFAGDLYGRRIVVRFLKKLRDEARYDDLSALVAQIERDAAEAQTYLTSL
ncbi:MAG: bifunctional riboflavin kinase/FAD synthetase [Paludibacterium sp.]|uniref:bifunctional riboflavin kinase/FAD synthetase n=1 Tax=Paludibacterium sp. TaxID=1917523 RepID=UPI0025D30A44|nr:bifunctional riboflavin kinase/FAD synthetase [Paludibacterium sp.]MBV8045913.1 bifunctional riboflavin kinase/FAD synthetase [Paludibacterium sp.]MBV8648582.1 bifunctional riboflavin kinase/FAD synthetase [Paludibacterium sp.]